MIFKLFFIDQKEKIFSSTMSRLNRDSSTSNFSQTDIAQFHSTKVYYYNLSHSLLLLYYIIQNN